MSVDHPDARPAGGRLRTPSRRDACSAAARFAVAGGLALAGPIMSRVRRSDGRPCRPDLRRPSRRTSTNTGSSTADTCSPRSRHRQGHRRREEPDVHQGPAQPRRLGRAEHRERQGRLQLQGRRRPKTFRTVADFDKDLPVTVDIDLHASTARRSARRPRRQVRQARVSLHDQEQHRRADRDHLSGRPRQQRHRVGRPRDAVRRSARRSTCRTRSGTSHRTTTAPTRPATATAAGWSPGRWCSSSRSGRSSQKFGYTAHVDDAAIPPAHMQIVPVSPANHPELKFGQDGFASGAQSGRDLTSRRVLIDANLLKLRNGASKLLLGLTQLQAGATQLNDGLAAGVTRGHRRRQAARRGRQQTPPTAPPRSPTAPTRSPPATRSWLTAWARLPTAPGSCRPAAHVGRAECAGWRSASRTRTPRTT